MVEKTQQQLFKQILEKREMYDLSGREIEGKLNPRYLEALEKLDFSKKYKYEVLDTVGYRYPLSIIISEEGDCINKLRDIVATGRVSIEDLANACNETPITFEFTSLEKEFEELLAHPNIKKQIESHPKALADIKKLVFYEKPSVTEKLQEAMVKGDKKIPTPLLKRDGKGSM